MKVKGIINVDKSELASIRAGETCGGIAGNDILLCKTEKVDAPAEPVQQDQLEQIVVTDKKDA